MKRLVPVLAAALLALTACAPAADSTSATSAPEPTAAPEPTVEPIGELHAYLENEGYTTNTLYQAQVVLEAETLETSGTNIYKTDFTAGQTTLFRHDDYEGVSVTSPIVTDDSLYVLNYNKNRKPSLLAMPLDGGETRQIALDTNSWDTPLSSNRYMYCISRDGAPTARTRGGFHARRYREPHRRARTDCRTCRAAARPCRNRAGQIRQCDLSDTLRR